MYDTLITIISFLGIITPLIFIHEFGHYIVAKWCGVKIEKFSLGFGKEIFGWNDKSGTRWKVCILPFGGYVQMYGDETEAGGTSEKIHELSEEEKAVTFHFKPLYKKAAIVFAGPLMNIMFAVGMFTFVYTYYGYPNTLPAVGGIVEGSEAERVGLKEGDVFISIAGEKVESFEDIIRVVGLRPNMLIELKILRDNKEIIIKATPKATKQTSIVGETVEMGKLGISSGILVYEPIPFGKAFIEANKQIYKQADTTLVVLGDIFTGDKSPKVLGGPIRIAKYSGSFVQKGVAASITFMAYISFILGFFNLFPIPALDGGHLLFYIIEAIRGKPIADKYQEYGLKLGFALLISLMIFTTFNDILMLFAD